MKKSRFTEEQILFAHKQGDAGQPIAEVCLCSAITRSRPRGRQQILVMQPTQHRSGAHAEALADPMAG